MARCSRASVRAPRIMADVYRAILAVIGKARLRAAAPTHSHAPPSRPPGDFALRASLMTKPVVHVIGAGLAGLAAAVRLAGGPYDIVLHESARQAGGRCRSYYDPALGLTIDNGNHLLLSGNAEAQAFLAAIGGADQMAGPHEADFAFFDLATKERWRLRPNAGALPWWIFSAARRVPGTGALDYLRSSALASPWQGRARSARSCAAMDCFTSGCGGRFFSPL